VEPKDVRREKLLALLAEQGGLTEASARQAQSQLGVPEAEAWGTGSFYSLINGPAPVTRVCRGLSCRLAGSERVLAELRANGTAAEGVSCLGQCDRAPALLDTDLSVRSRETRQRSVTPDDPELPMNLAGADRADYAALARARTLGSEDVIARIEESGLQGRGGAGFPAHFKWSSVRQQSETQRYLVCNADEGEPGTFKDREVMLRRPHLLLEGLAIAADCIGATDIIVYIRGEFKAERTSLAGAIAQAGDALRDFSFHLHTGHGAYICGEETALLESLEGRRGMPRLKPPFPTERGFRGKPTLIQNVETIACVPAIVARGGDWFKHKGCSEPGTKLYCASGHVGAPGVYELPLGVTLDELVEVAGGYEGTPMAFSPGGASSGFLPMSERTRALDFRSLAEVGSMLGSGGVVVLNDSVNLAEAVAWQLEFFRDESCGQCAPCRIGTQYVLQRTKGFLASGDADELDTVEDVAWEMEEGSICGLGMQAAKPLTSAMEHFPAAFRKASEG